ncbi:MAG: hypothetical protein U0167_03210 [bacterium]
MRVPPGWGPRVRAWIEADGRCSAQERVPSLVVEESPWVFLPVDVAHRTWPRAEAWSHAQRLLGIAAAPRSTFFPRDAGDLFARLRSGDADAQRHSMPAERAALFAWDLLCAAVAWERSRAAWWIARHAKGYASERAAGEWLRRAQEWGVRVLAPNIARSMACAVEDAGVVRLGLDELGANVAEAAEVLVRERSAAGPFTSWMQLAWRGLRAGASPRALLALGARGALAALPVRASSSRTALPEETSRTGAKDRTGAKGGLLPFLPFTVIAHDPRPAALRSVSGSFGRVASAYRAP